MTRLPPRDGRACAARNRLPLALALTVPTALMLAGCAHGGRFPSLAERPAERSFASARPPAPIVPESPPQATTLSRIGDLRREAESAGSKFTEQEGATRRAIAAATDSRPGSEPWAAATIALASLESLRSDTIRPLADLDRLVIATSGEAVDQGASDNGDTHAAREADEAVAALIAHEDETIASLRARITDLATSGAAPATLKP